MNYTSVNPYTLQSLAQFPIHTSVQLEQVLQQASLAHQSWKRLKVEERGARLLKLATLIETNHEALARLAVMEMGKTFAEAKLEVLKCTTACTYYATQAAHILQAEAQKHLDGRTVLLSYQPLGTVLGVFPWNFPYWQIIRSAMPIIISGNTMLVKPAPNTPQCALALQALFEEAGLADGIIQTIFVSNDQVAEVIADSRIHACTLTGSEKAGSAVASMAAQHIKKSVLELGGSDPFIVLADADLDLVMTHAVSARFQNNGQSCIASKRYIIHESVVDEFLKRLKEAIGKLVMGDPMDESTHIGPLARLDLKIKIETQVQESIAAGAKLFYQMEYPQNGTCFYPPTVLTNIPDTCPARYEELFGPVISVFTFNTIDEAIEIANQTEFGLGASIWTSNPIVAKELATQIQSGQVFINAVTRSNTAFAFGGVKKSGFGRELGPQGLLEFCALKTIWV
jgi:succinate-semialdehyde dehydrogenase/glutarate-semialdehyde dehydrogenase